ncbi:S-layer homology domain-containing protein [Paenibacillus sp. GCM10012307]|uniref:S-layer homology domain-containing protein n=1 Tax=Paenibacillus roseus TaxID=2798579 RepID=A0A934J328_9BACL|nr:S-layer homology domain-containing protein [Paenibacillus roseus]MBJ6360709.1 S-layer homology domain-containing protein [Paenibacillus roseus]
MRRKVLGLVMSLCLVASPFLPGAAPVKADGDMRLGEDGRSRLYPENWYPGFTDDKGRFLHDFSYAGYHRGETEIPEIDASSGIDVTEAPYFADATGQSDATEAIQTAINDAAAQGGGVVYLPAGTYQVNPPEGKDQSLFISASNVVLKGAGAGETFIYNATEVMRFKDIIRISSGDWKRTGTATKLSKSVTEPSVLLPVDRTEGFAPGDYVAITFETTREFLSELGMHNKWSSRLGRAEPLFYRQIVGVDEANSTLTVDIPTRYPIKLRDNITITKTEPPISEVGLEDFSIATIQNSKDGIGEDDFRVIGTAGYEVDNAKAINMVAVVNSWVRNVSSYKPEGNLTYHLSSKGIILDRTKNVTIDNVTLEYPQYRGANGNGYLYQFIGNDNLIANSKAVGARHNFTYANFSANGNVLYNVHSEHSSLLTDFHMYLSMANLIDNMTLNGDTISAITRDYGSSPTNRHGVVSTESVFWNTTGIAAHSSKNGIIIESEQFGNGYIIGTQGAATGVKVDIAGSIPEADTSPFDMAEGIGEGERLNPQSLYVDQFARRTAELELGLQSLLVNGEAVNGMQFLKTIYTHTLPYGTEQIPVIGAAPFSSDAQIEIEQPKTTTDTGRITVTKGGTSKTYDVVFKVAGAPEAPKSISFAPDKSVPGWRAAGNAISVGHSGKLKAFITLYSGEIIDAERANIPVSYSVDNEELGSIDRNVFKAKQPGFAKVTAESTYNGLTVTRTEAIEVKEAMEEPQGPFASIIKVTASADDGNLPVNAIDRDPDSRWSAEGKGQYLLLELDKEQWIDQVSFLFFNGHLRSNYFDLEVSTDGESFQKVLTDAASRKQEPNHYDTFKFNRVKAKYIKYIGQGNEINGWNSLIEAWIHQARNQSNGSTPYYPSAPSQPVQEGPEEKNSENPASPSRIVLETAEPVRSANEAGQSIATVKVDSEKLVKALGSLTAEQQARGVQLDLDFREGADVGVVLLSAEAVSAVLAKSSGAVLNIRYGSSHYELPLAGLRSEQLQQILAAGGERSAELAIRIAKLADADQSALEDKARAENIELLHEGADSQILIQNGEQKLPIPVFGSPYAPITMTLYRTIDVKSLSAARYDRATGELVYVPASFRHEDGKTVAVIYRTGNGIYTLVQADRTFPDMKGHWAEETIHFLASKLLVNGSKDGFKPNASITRAEFAALLVRAVGLTPVQADSYKDVPASAWYSGAVGAASAAGIIQGFENGLFKPNDRITREQMVVMISRALHSAGYPFEEEVNAAVLNSFNDGEAVSGYAREAVVHAIELGILNGASGSVLAPQNKATRAESAVTLERMLQKLNFS